MSGVVLLAMTIEVCDSVNFQKRKKYTFDESGVCGCGCKTCLMCHRENSHLKLIVHTT